MSHFYGWGNNLYGQLGVGSEDNVQDPSAIEFFNGKRIQSVAVGLEHTLVVDEDGAVYSFGNNDHGQLGHSKRRLRPEVVDSLDIFKVVQVACGLTHSLALTDKGQVLSFGFGDRGQLGQGFEQMNSHSKPRYIKAFEKDHVVQIASGEKHCLALSEDGKVWIWGENSKFQLGNGTCVPLHTPETIDLFKGRPIKKICCGSNHSVALSVSGSVYAWGDNSFGQLGLNDNNQVTRPKPIEALRGKHIIDISCGENHTVALSQDGKVYSFGSGSNGQLGHQGYSHEPTPKVISDLLESPCSIISCGRRHTCVYQPQIKKLYTFGLNASGQLGHQIGGEKGTSSPFSVKKLEGKQIFNIFAGGDRVFVLEKTEDLQVDSSISLPDGQKINVTPTAISIADSVIGKKNTISSINRYTALKLLEEAEKTNNYAHLQKVVEVVFSSISCLNSSFLTESHMDTSGNNMGLDLEDAHETYKLLFLCPERTIRLTIGNATSKLFDSLMKYNPGQPEAMRVYMIVLKNPLFLEPSLYHVVCQKLVTVFVGLYEKVKEILASWISSLSPQNFSKVLDIFQKFLSFLLTSRSVDLSTSITSCAIVLKWLHDINIISGEKLPPKLLYNHDVSQIDLSSDYNTWATERNQFCFCRYPFLLDMVAKDKVIYYDQVREMNEYVAHHILYSNYFQRTNVNPFLHLKVKRGDLLRDCLSQIPNFGPLDLKRPLNVIFDGEEGFDEGGPRKEFFHLIKPLITDPNFGVFLHDEETQSVMFNPGCTGNNLAKCTIVGKIVGLAIYNACLIDIPFSYVIYKKLLNNPIHNTDLKTHSPTIYSSLQKLLDYQGEDIEEVFSLTFRVSYLGHNFDLKENGGHIAVNSSNKKEFVELYTRLILEKAYEEQFRAFSEGFYSVCSKIVPQILHPCELEILIRGSPDYNFYELEKNTKYENGYTKEDPAIQNFWKLVHSFPMNLKRKLLSFITGSDRVPIKGMSQMNFTIQQAKDITRLPAAHTCFNILDLPPYPNLVEMQEKLAYAINNTEGFGLV